MPAARLSTGPCIDPTPPAALASREGAAAYHGLARAAITPTAAATASRALVRSPRVRIVAEISAPRAFD
jgi:hypothetical protein